MTFHRNEKSIFLTKNSFRLLFIYRIVKIRVLLRIKAISSRFGVNGSSEEANFDSR